MTEGRPCSKCGASSARRFINAWLCTECAPAIPVPDPALTAAALRDARFGELDAARATRKASAR